MANQPPVRPWFRLASLSSVPAPAPAPAPEPRPVQVLPATFRTASAPPSPQKEPVPPPPAPEPRPVQVLPATFRTASAPPSPPKEPIAPPPAPATAPPPPAPAVTASQFLAAVERERASSSLPTSPVQKKTVPNTSFDSVAKSSHTYYPPNGSPKTVKAAVQSPKVKPTAPVPAPPPSPLTLPPSQVRASAEIEPRIPAEAEPKTVLVQKTIDKPMSRSSGNGEYQRELGETRKPGIAHNGIHVAAKDIEGKEKGIHKKFSDPEESGMRVITIAGENKGAVMEIVHSPKKHEFGDKPNHLHKKGNPKIKSSDAESGSSSNDEANLNKKDKSLKGRTSALPKTAFVNSNVQCVNNSLMYHTSCKHNDPGVHLALSRKPFGEGIHFKERVNGQNN